MNTCDTCIYWIDDVAFPGTTGENKRICGHVDLMPGHDGSQPLPDGFSVETKFYAFYTGPKFGCVHHAP